MKVIRDTELNSDNRFDVLGVELTRRNLNALLAKLDGHPPDSACTIEKDGVFVKAVHDFAHYGGGVAPGAMHPDTERAL